jgi:hypothetical protein
MLPSQEPPCRRCGEPLAVTLVGVRFCRACRRRERGQVLALLGPLGEQAKRAEAILDRQLQAATTAQEAP